MDEEGLGEIAQLMVVVGTCAWPRDYLHIVGAVKRNSSPRLEYDEEMMIVL